MTARLAWVEIARGTDVGRVRGHNEDRHLVRPPVIAVADGMGGAQAGEVAAGMAVAALDALPGNPRPGDLRRAVERANSEIRRSASGDAGRAGMGTTVTACLLGDDGRLYVVHVGDSRAYLVRDGVSTQLTKDQSLIQRLIDAGELTEEEAAVSERRNIILQALGPEARVRVDLTAQHLCRGDVLVVCSDGLSGQVRAQEIADAVAGSDDLDAACASLIDRANAAGGPDNITVVVARVEGEALPPHADAPPGHQPYVGEQAARATQRIDRTTLASLAAPTGEPVTTPPVSESSSREPAPSVAPTRTTAGPTRRPTSAMLEAEDAAMLSPRAALALLAVGGLLLALWLLR